MRKSVLMMAPAAVLLTVGSSAFADDGYKLAWSPIGSFSSMAPAKARGIAAARPGVVNAVDTSGALWQNSDPGHFDKWSKSTSKPNYVTQIAADVYGTFLGLEDNDQAVAETWSPLIHSPITPPVVWHLPIPNIVQLQSGGQYIVAADKSGTIWLTDLYGYGLDASEWSRAGKTPANTIRVTGSGVGSLGYRLYALANGTISYSDVVISNINECGEPCVHPPVVARPSSQWTPLADVPPGVTFVDISATSPLRPPGRSPLPGDPGPELYGLTGGASPQLWRATAQETNCTDGVDNDGNGSTDLDDAACDNICDAHGKNCFSLAAMARKIDDTLQKSWNVVGYVSIVGSPSLHTTTYGVARGSGNPPQENWNVDVQMTVASLSKMVTTVGALQSLARLYPTDPNGGINNTILKYLPPDWQQSCRSTKGVLPCYGDNVDKITFADLLTHRAGFRPCNDSLGNNKCVDDYDGLKTLVSKDIDPSTQGSGAPALYYNPNFGIFRELLPYMQLAAGTGPQPSPDPGPATRAAWSSAFYVSYTQSQIWSKLPIGTDLPDCKPWGLSPSTTEAVAYPAGPPTTSAVGDDMEADLTLGCGGFGWIFTPADSFAFMSALRDNGGSSLLTSAQKKIMNTNCLGWDCSAGAVQNGFRGKSGAWLDGATPANSLGTYGAVYDGVVPVTVFVNSPPIGGGLEGVDDQAFAAAATASGAFQQASLPDFDQANRWGSKSATLTTGVEPDGSAGPALKVAPWSGSTCTITSTSVNTGALGTGNTVAIDFYSPLNPPNPQWLGDVQAYISIPSANIYSQWIGYASLSAIPLGTYGTLTFALPPATVSAFRGNHGDASFTFQIDFAQGSGPYYFENFRVVNGKGEPCGCNGDCASSACGGGDGTCGSRSGICR